MARLNEVLGAIMSDIAAARHMADEYTLRLAKRYQEDPALKQLSVPRIRLPEVVIDLPLLIERCGDERDAPAGPSDAAAPSSAAQSSAKFLEVGERALKRLSELPKNKTDSPADRIPELHVLVGADEIKAHATGHGGSIVRLRLTLREEGLESIDSEEDGRGDGSAQLIPE